MIQPLEIALHQNVTKVRLEVMLVLPNVIIKLLNVRKKQGTTECDKSMVMSDIGTAKYEDKTIKCEEKKQDTTECDKNTVRYYIGSV